MRAQTPASPPLLTTHHTGISPFVDVARLDLRPLVHDLHEMPVDLTDRAAAQLGKSNPLHMNGFQRFFYKPEGRVVGCLTTLVIFGTFFWSWSRWGSSVGTMFVPFVAIMLMSRTRGLLRSTTRGFARMDELRATCLRLNNPGVGVAVDERVGDATALRTLGELPSGVRRTWVEGRMRLHGEQAARLDLELGVYCYETRGDKTHHTHRIPYLFVPLPRDLQARGGSWFRVAPRRHIAGRSEVSLSSAFDREYAVDVLDDDPNAPLFATRVLAPDVQELLLRYADSASIDLTVTGSGILARSTSFAAALGLDGHHDTARGVVFVGGIYRTLHVVHEMFEQMDPAYKLDRATKQGVLGRLGLDAPG